MKKIIFLLALIPFIAACSSGVDDSLNEVSNSGKIEVLDETEFDWGNINIEGGDVSHEFEIENTGEEFLVLKGATTSCMCTEVTFTLPDGTESPAFGMHSTPGWNTVIEPGETFTANVVFDPLAHGPDGTGPIVRNVTIYSSARNGNLELILEGDVLSEDDYLETVVFDFEEESYDFGILKQSEGIKSYDFPFTYNGDEDVTITGLPTSCPCTEAETNKDSLQPGDEGIITVSFDPNLHEEPEGKFFKTISILTEPEIEQDIELKIWVEIDLDLGPDAYKLQGEHSDEDEHETGRAYHNISASELASMMDNKDFFLLDVHIPEQDHIENTDAFIPYDDISNYLSELPSDKDAEIVVYCRSGSMSLSASKELIDLGYQNIFNLEGGIQAYNAL